MNLAGLCILIYIFVDACMLDFTLRFCNGDFVRSTKSNWEYERVNQLPKAIASVFDDSCEQKTREPLREGGIQFRSSRGLRSRSLDG
ncbi:hypothetical protein SCHPADRAFT_548314 [Schizopora paradoxa]|uniref:Uncharacterized protein n=1 Tax=Schizopora paradoxa TaxID=27342 RepID=A0A0H2RE23_9AGAM|nr:hypothetical protein SCHPADRAFT_548314 [Schizopora paradoxa]